MNERSPAKKDLIVLVPDVDMENALTQILRRHKSLDVRPIDFEVIRYVGKADPGCYGQSHSFLLPRFGDFEHALVIFDHEGSGQERRSAEDVEAEVAQRLRRTGWGDRADAVVIVPELEAWIWGPSPQVARTLGWRERPAALREWLEEKNLWRRGQAKPLDPKQAMEAALRELKRPRSASIYRELASKVSLRHCRDRSFRRLVQILRSWFPPSQAAE